MRRLGQLSIGSAAVRLENSMMCYSGRCHSGGGGVCRVRRGGSRGSHLRMCHSNNMYNSNVLTW